MATVVRAGRASARAERTFYLTIALVMAAGIIGGFLPSWFLRQWMHQPMMAPLTPWVWFHGIVFTAWLALFVTQVSLVSTGNRPLHMKLGMAGFGFAALLILAGFTAALHGAVRGANPPPFTPDQWLAVPIFALLSPAVLLPLGLAYRRRDSQTHKRYMLMAMVAFTTPGFGRMLFMPFWMGMMVIPMLFVAALIGWDLYSRGRIHRATAVGGGVVFVSTIVPLLVWDSAAWLGTAHALMTLWSA